MTLLALSASLLQWTLCWWAYRARTVESGINVSALARDYAGSTERQLKDISLEALVRDFTDNQKIIDERSAALSRSLWALALQLVLLVATVVVKAINAADSAAVAA